MLDEGKIIQNALLRLGDVRDYNDDRSRKYQACVKILNNLIDTICADNSFRFNATTVDLTSNEIKDDYYRYNLPVDFLGLGMRIKKKRCVTNRLVSVDREIAQITNDYIRIEGEFLYSNKPNIKLNYVRKVTLNEFPDYMNNYLIYQLAMECCLAFPEFTDRLQYMELKAREERYNVQKREGLGVVYE